MSLLYWWWSTFDQGPPATPDRVVKSSAKRIRVVLDESPVCPPIRVVKSDTVRIRIGETC